MPTDGSLPGVGNIYGVQLNPAGTFLYLTTQSSKIYKCSVNQADGQLTGCVEEINAQFANNNMAFNPLGTYLYYTSNGTVEGPVFKCLVDPLSGDLSPCVETGDGNFDHYPHGIALNPSGTFAYVSDFLSNSPSESYIYFCAVNKRNGALTNCMIGPESCQHLAYLGGIAINRTGTTLYITSAVNGVYRADILPSGQLASCVLQNNTPLSNAIALR